MIHGNPPLTFPLFRSVINASIGPPNRIESLLTSIASAHSRRNVLSHLQKRCVTIFLNETVKNSQQNKAMVNGRPSKSGENSSSTQENIDASNKSYGTIEESERPQEMSQATYTFLLEQMESLRKENCSLKAGLKSNTSHITKLESEASRMKVRNMSLVFFMFTIVP